MAKLDRQYLEEHQQAIHTLESFGAFVADLALRQAMEKLGDGSADFIEINVPIRVTPRTLRRTVEGEGAVTRAVDCVTVGVGVPPVSVSVHLKI